MEIREHRACPEKLRAGVEEDVGLAGVAACARRGLDRAHARGANRHHTPCLRDLARTLWRDAVLLAVKMRALDFRVMQWLERTQSDVQSDVRDLRRAASRQHLRREVQPRRRRRHGPALLREHRLVPLAIRRRIRTLDVRRQRHVPDPLERRPQVVVAEKAYRALPGPARPRRFPFQTRRRPEWPRRSASSAPPAPTPATRARRPMSSAAERPRPARLSFRAAWGCAYPPAARSRPPDVRTAAPETRANR